MYSWRVFQYQLTEVAQREGRALAPPPPEQAITAPPTRCPVLCDSDILIHFNGCNLKNSLAFPRPSPSASS
ncbi:hypothetical protein EVAR_6288_1 [Eumeta japonica]|uniref:Uncharacterized protein n=1 Tax=Eumeta variegata TaxID=151549 RepID=A0A4C1TBP8_EUMVA|nr:hypothetical protein EVAR_6288_1 [Eumeta japonica]